MRRARYGKARIARELAALGFSKETASEALGEDAGSAAERRALARAFETAWKKSAGLLPAARKRRVRAALLRRGFASEAISAMMRGSLDDTGLTDTGLKNTDDEDLDIG